METDEINDGASTNDIIVFDLSTDGLEPTKHRIVGITVKTVLEEKIFTYRDEKLLLEKFWTYVKSKNFDKLIGFNSDNFDIPFLVVRSLMKKVPMINLKGKSIDLRKSIFGDQIKKGTLQDFQNLLGIEILENGFAKMHMSLMWEAPHIKNLRECMLQDVRITWKLYLRVKEVGLID